MDKNSLYQAVTRLSQAQHSSHGLLYDQSIAQYNSLLAEAKSLYRKQADIQGLLSWDTNRHLDIAQFEDSIVRLKSALELAAVRSSAKTKSSLSLSHFGVPDLTAFKAAISAIREPDLVSCVFMDLDNFKSVNDTHNHDIGDDVIKDAIRITESAVKGKGEVFHRSGDEILILLPNFDSEEACAIAERIRRAIEERDFPVIGVGVVTATLGVSTSPTFCTRDDLEGSADTAAMIAKKKGKNLVNHAGVKTSNEDFVSETEAGTTTEQAGSNLRDANMLIAKLRQQLREVQSGQPALLPPVLRLMHFAFDDVEPDERGIYARVGKELTTSSFTAAILDFSLEPISGAAPWVEAQAQIRFKDASNHQTRVGDPIWLGRDKPKVPFRYGETQSLVVAICFPGENVSTYETQRRSSRPLERVLQGSVIRAEIGLVGEYMSDPKLNVSWYFRLTGGTCPTIEMITRDEFEA